MPRVLSEASLEHLSAQAWELIDAAQVVIADLDGCLAADLIPLPGARELARRVAKRLVVASNNSTHSCGQLARALRRNGLAVGPGRFVLAGEVALDTVARQWPGARAMLLATAAIRARARRAGLALVATAPDVVVLARATGVGFRQLEAAIAALHAGAPLVVANPDLSHPGAGGVPRIETGALLALLRAVLPGQEAHIVGKPEPALFRAALALDRADPARAVMIGDNLATDVLGAQALGIDAIHLASPSR